MDTLSHEFMDCAMKLLKTLLVMNPEARKLINDLIAPTQFSRSVTAYTSTFTFLDTSVRRLGCAMMKQILETMDASFRFSPGRSVRYYVKQSRDREIVTLFGPVRYRRTEYIDRSTHMPFIYVDEKIGLIRRQRYDACIQARAYELYSNNNSMIKVGELLGQQICPFDIGKDIRQHAVSRQQVWYMLNRFACISTPAERLDLTPEIIYIMADEKFIHLQGEMEPWKNQLRKNGYSEETILELAHGKHFSEMTKLAVIFTGREELTGKNGRKLKRPRWKLTGKHYFVSPHDSSHFWQHCHDYLNQLYDLTKVKIIYILGDGAEWIKAAPSELATSDTSALFALDRYHMAKYIRKISDDKNLRSLLTESYLNNSRDDFLNLIDSIRADHPERKDAIDDAGKYLLNNWKAALVMHNKVMIGCAMEQAICHVLASSFSSVPKAYAKSHLHNYVDARIHQKNAENMELLYIIALQKQVRSSFLDKMPRQMNHWNSFVSLSDVDFDIQSFFDNNIPDDAYHVNFPYSKFS